METNECPMDSGGSLSILKWKLHGNHNCDAEDNIEVDITSAEWGIDIIYRRLSPPPNGFLPIRIPPPHHP